ncbi:hypothetical protein RI129_003497 [Pyrocoelia pectoralis]|uniref:Centrosomal protein CCDC61 n=1 Tax=Pyrocoelia pectoralis TaxID=417401 RepID=A0AAN7ZIP3_9COLE
MSENILITTYTFHHKQYLLKLNSANCLEIVLTDKQTGEEWECSYDIAYIENLTRKTGNFKQFEIFTTMLKSGLLKTSECISLDLLTLEDLESMKVRKVKSSSRINTNGNNNRRYLIVTYSVEFDKIKYPITLEYCGLPDPAILQATVKKLETKLKKTEEELSTKHNGRRYIKSLERRIDELTMENNHLNDEVKRLAKTLNKSPIGQVQVLQKAIMQLEKSVQTERNSHHRLVQKLQSDKMQLVHELERSKKSEKELKYKIQSLSQITIKNKQNNNQKIKKSPSIYNTKDSCTRNIKLTQRSRSASPRLIRSDKQRAVDRRSQQCKQQPISRSSSASSKKECWNNFSASGSQIRSRGSSPASSRFRGSTSTLSYTSIGDKNTVAKERTAPSNRFFVRNNKIENHFNKTVKKYT